MELAERIRQAGGASIVDVAEILLQECRTHAAELHTILQGPAIVGQLARTAAAVSERAVGFPELLRDEDRAWLADELDRLRASTGLAAVGARAVAVGLDEARGVSFAGMLRARGNPYVLSAGKAFPLPSPDLRMLLGAGLSPSRSNRGFVPDELPHLALAPDLRGFHVEISWDRRHALATLADGAKLAVALPNADPTKELTFDKVDYQGELRFFGVRPNDPVAQLNSVRELIAQARAASVDVLLFPELCLEVAGRAAAEAEARERPLLLVTGSCHEEDGDSRHNRAQLVLGSGQVLRHEKFNPFLLDRDGVERLEDLRGVQPALRILHSGNWSMALLVCKDLLHPEVGPLLDRLRVSVVLVVALSPKGEFLRELALAATARTQAIVVVANAADAARPEQVVALATLPTKEGGVLEARRSDATPPCLLTIDLSQRKNWASLID